MAPIERLSLRALELTSNHQKKHDFLKAFKLIKELPPSNPNSFWAIASYHGMPFKGRVAPPTDPDDDDWYWNGYCQHGNVLFPTWHRFYCLRLEQALQTVLPEADVALHYWDESSDKSMKDGLPDLLLDAKVEIDGKQVPNPLLDFELPEPITDALSAESTHRYYIKPTAGYTTMRYPYSGIVHPPVAAKTAKKHNDSITDANVKLQANVHHWLNTGRTSGKAVNSVYDLFDQCRGIRNYNEFSNQTSSTSGSKTASSLEQPHNEIHLMIGGYTQPDFNPDGSVKVDSEGGIKYYGLIKGANGDMGANEMASFDPMFFLHHANIDRMFWVWQKKWHKTCKFDIDPEEGNQTGTSTKTRVQGPTPNQGATQTLSMNTILYPFQDQFGVPRTSRDCINIEKQLGYTYSIGSLDQENWPVPPINEEKFVQLKMKDWNELTEKLKEGLAQTKAQVAAALPDKNAIPPQFTVRAFIDITDFDSNRENKSIVVPIVGNSAPGGAISVLGLPFKIKFHVKVENINLDSIAGSFVVQVFYKENGKLYYLGQRGVLSRWDRKACANCQERTTGSVGFDVSDVWETVSDPKNLLVLIVSKDPLNGTLNTIKVDATKAAANDDNPRVRYVTSLEELEVVTPQ